MNLLGIDFGLKNIGLALSIKGVISPLKTVENNKKTFEKIQEICTEYKIEKIIMGISTGKMAQKTLNFAQKLKKMLELPLETVDETLSTRESWSQFKSKSLKKWKAEKDALSAAYILERI